jgi:hypothetical protein
VLTSHSTRAHMSHTTTAVYAISTREHFNGFSFTNLTTSHTDILPFFGSQRHVKLLIRILFIVLCPWQPNAVSLSVSKLNRSSSLVKCALVTRYRAQPISGQQHAQVSRLLAHRHTSQHDIYHANLTQNSLLSEKAHSSFVAW